MHAFYFQQISVLVPLNRSEPITVSNADENTLCNFTGGICVAGSRQARETLAHYEPQEDEYQVCPARQRAWSPPTQQYRDEVPCRPCNQDYIEDDYDDDDERVIYTNKRWQS